MYRPDRIYDQQGSSFTIEFTINNERIGCNENIQ